MRQPYKAFLAISILLTAGLFVHDSIYDDPGKPYPLGEILTDILIAGTMYTGIFFGVLAGIYYSVDKALGGKRK